MIDEKRLGELIIGDVCGGARSWAIGCITESEAEEILRLARLGLWAEKHGIPVLKENASRGHKLAIKALAALPEAK